LKPEFKVNTTRLKIQILNLSQGFLEDDTVWPDAGFFDLKIHASIAADAFCRLHNDKYTKFRPCQNCGFRAYIEKIQLL